MRVFQRVIDEGGFAAAARALALSPAAVTRLIGDLEAHLGARLMQRTTRSIRLTEAGEAYLESLRTILRDIDDAEAAAADQHARTAGHLAHPLDAGARHASAGAAHRRAGARCIRS